jgi:uncharacterized membrane protein (UPF0182 family)
MKKASMKTKFIIILTGSVLVLLIGLALANVYSEWLWFESISYAPVYIKILSIKVASSLVFALVFFLFGFASVKLAWVQGDRAGALKDSEVRLFDAKNLNIRIAHIRIGLWVILFVFAFIAGGIGFNHWDTILRYLHPQKFGLYDPIFNKDLGFYIFSYPSLRLFQALAFYGFVILTGLTFFVYILNRNIGLLRGRPKATKSARIHLFIIFALLLGIKAWGYRLDMLETLYSSDGFIFGARYANVYGDIVAYKALLAIVVLTAIICLIALFGKRGRLPILAVSIWGIAAVTLQLIYPALLQEIVVEPTELEKERPYIRHNIESTGRAYGLDLIRSENYPVVEHLSTDDIKECRSTIKNIKIWDKRPLKETYVDLQEIRLYYSFLNVDVDRYQVGKDYVQVMLSPRELNTDNLPQTAKTWINKRLLYTHGHGFCMSPANQVSTEGLPAFFVKDIPPASPVGLTVERPELYYSEKTDDFVIVDTSTKEFDYPKGDTNIYTTYQGSGGVALDSFIKKLAFSLKLFDANILLSEYLLPKSRIMIYREIQKRVNRVAPFLRFDGDPYLAMADGRLFWIIDAYTTSCYYPYSEPYELEERRKKEYEGISFSFSKDIFFSRDVNYIKNSVKVVIDAYNGSVDFYAFDPVDPVLKSYQTAFKFMFKDREAMPNGLKSHVRYPKDLFLIQAKMLKKYHMTDVEVFYNQEDLWTRPHEIYGSSKIPMTGYYVIIKLPDGKKEEFVYMIPFTPKGKPNMISWMCARCDHPDYGRLVLYKFPKEKLIFGPMQIEARIDQEPTISELFTLWGQLGSKVIRGDLLVIPVRKSLLYVKPVYILATSEELPELKRIIVAFGEQLAMRETLDEAVNAIFAGYTSEIYKEGHDRQEPVSKALDHFERVKRSFRESEWEVFGKEMKGLEKSLKEIREREKEKEF